MRDVVLPVPKLLKRNENMVREFMIAALAASAMAVTGTAAAKPGKNKPVKVERSGAGVGEPVRARGRVNSRGALHASPRGIQRSSSNSVLKNGTVVAGPLTGLDPGDPVFATVDGSLREIGTVRNLVPGHGGRVGNVLVRTPDGRTVPLAPGNVMLDPATQQWTVSRLRGGRGE